jgi:hypothetical protein
MNINQYEILIPLTYDSGGGQRGKDQWKEDKPSRLHPLVLQTRTDKR